MRENFRRGVASKKDNPKGLSRRRVCGKVIAMKLQPDRFLQNSRLWLFLILSMFAANGEAITPVPRGFVFDGAIGEWIGQAPIKMFWSRSGSDTIYRIWIAQSARGLVLSGNFNSAEMQFANDESELERLGRLELWVSVSDPPVFPPLTYTEDACTRGAYGFKPPDAIKTTDCLNWIKAQYAFRDQIKKLFTRMWRISPQAKTEAYALPAWDGLTGEQQRGLGFPRPDGLPECKFRTASDATTSFEILVPWNLLPPATRLSLETIQLRLDILGPDSLGSSENGRFPRQRGEEGPLPILALSPPIVNRITPCGQPLIGRDRAGEDIPAFYFPAASLVSDGVYIFESPEWPYLSDYPSEKDVSPIAAYSHFVSQEIGQGEILCGPFMSYRKGNLVKHFSFRLETSKQHSHKPIKQFPVKLLPDGTRLIRYGPDIASGALWTKAFVTFNLKIFALTPALDAREALSLGAWSRDLPGYEIEISDDWRVVKEFHQNLEGKWTSETFCLTGTIYRSCGKQDPSPEPKRRVLTPER